MCFRMQASVLSMCPRRLTTCLQMVRMTELSESWPEEVHVLATALEPFKLHIHVRMQVSVISSRGTGRYDEACICSWPEATPQHVVLGTLNAPAHARYLRSRTCRGLGLQSDRLSIPNSLMTFTHGLEQWSTSQSCSPISRYS
jgi:hypothetical protein